MRRSGLARHSARTSRSQNRESRWEEQNDRDLAYDKEEEWQEWQQEEAPAPYPDEDELSEDASQYAPYDKNDASLSAQGYAGDDYSEDEALDQSDQKQWHDEANEDNFPEERGLVAYHSGQNGAFLRQSGALNDLAVGPYYQFQQDSLPPIFIAGRRKPAKLGALGHAPISPRAHRPRPFFVHTLALAIVMVSLVVSALTVGALSSGPQFWNKIDGLAGAAQPPPPPVKFHWYTVHFADTVEGIASTFGVQVGGILELNGLVDGEQIYTGMALKIPSDSNYGSNFQAPLDLPYAPDTTPSPPYGSYVIPPGFVSFGVTDYAGDPGAGDFGQCTWWAAHKRPDEAWWGFGDAWSWADTAKARGYTVTTTPAPNATVVFEPDVEGALGVGHVAHVEQILPGGWVLISEMNFFWNNGGWGRVDYRYITPGPGVYFIH